MAITPRSKGLGDIGAIVDRQGRASPTVKAPVKPVVKAAPKPVVKAAPKPVVKAAPKPVAKVAPKPAPKMAPKPNPFGGASLQKPRPVVDPGFNVNPGKIGGTPFMPKGGNDIGGMFPGLGGGQIQQPAYIGQGGTPEQWNQFNQQSGGGIGMSYTSPYGPGNDMGGEPPSGIGQGQLVGGPVGQPIFGGPPPMPDNQFGGYDPYYSGPEKHVSDYEMYLSNGPLLGMNQQQVEEYFRQNPQERVNLDNSYTDQKYKDQTTPPPMNYGPPPVEMPTPFDPINEMPNAWNPGDMYGYDNGFTAGGFGMSGTVGNEMAPGMYGDDQMSTNWHFGDPAPYNAGMQSPSRVINQVGKPGFQPRPSMSNAFSPYDDSNSGDGFMKGSGSLFGGGGFAGK